MNHIQVKPQLHLLSRHFWNVWPNLFAESTSTLTRKSASNLQHLSSFHPLKPSIWKHGVEMWWTCPNPPITRHHQVTQSTSTSTAAVAGGRSALHLDLRLSFCGVHLGHLGETYQWNPKIPLKMVIVPRKKTPLRGMYTQFSDTANW